MKVKLPNLRGVMTVDVGKNCAFSFWHVLNDSPLPSVIGMIKPKMELTGYAKMCPITKYVMSYAVPFKRLIKEYEPDAVIIEGVQKYGSLVSEVSIATGDLFKVGYLVSGLLLTSAEIRCITYETKAPEWKGGMTKDATVARIDRILPPMGLHRETVTHINCEGPNEHIYDAVAMGLSCVDDWWKLRNVKQYKKRLFKQLAPSGKEETKGVKETKLHKYVKANMIPDMDGGCE